MFAKSLGAHSGRGMILDAGPDPLSTLANGWNPARGQSVCQLDRVLRQAGFSLRRIQVSIQEIAPFRLSVELQHFISLQIGRGLNFLSSSLGRVIGPGEINGKAG